VKLLIYDASETRPVGQAWRVGARVFGRHFAGVRAPRSLHQLAAMLLDLREGGFAFDEVQVWAHGRPGQVLIDGDVVPDAVWPTLRPILRPAATVWLRVCSFAAGDVGKTAMTELAATLGARVVAHTHIIGDWGCQSGMRSVRPGEVAAWSSSEGELDGKPGRARSHPLAPRTVLATTMTLPGGV
jgi:hypothetical protein